MNENYDVHYTGIFDTRIFTFSTGVEQNKNWLETSRIPIESVVETYWEYLMFVWKYNVILKTILDFYI